MAEQINLAATQTRTQIRSTFIPPRPFEHSFTCNTGEVIPAFCTIEVQPHETWGMKVSTLVRLQTTQAPTMGRPYQCWAAYYTPHNQVWDNWDAFMGEVKDAAWETATVYTIPQISFTEGNPIEFDTICDHFGWRPGENQYGFTLGRLKLNHYLHICNEWLRDPNVEAPIKINTTDATIEYVAGGDFTVGGTPYKINRKADYFSVNLPEPQRGDPGIISLGDSAPVEIKGDGGNIYLRTNAGPNTGQHTLMYSNNETLRLDGNNDQTEYNSVRWGKPGTNADVGLTGTANLSSVSSFEINTLRHEAILQQIRETDARVGSRAYEILWGRWGGRSRRIRIKAPSPIVYARGNNSNQSST